MATSSRGGKDEVFIPKTFYVMKENSATKRRIGAWIEEKATKSEQKAAVIYYLSQNGHLEHPHFMVVPVSSPQGLSLKDFKSRLSSLRGQGIATKYSWSSKRSYKNGFVWHDLSEDDVIYPCQGQDYVLKGSRIPEPCAVLESSESMGSSFSSSSSSLTMFSRESNGSGEENPSKYLVYKPIINRELANEATNASTQTEDKAIEAVPTTKNPREFGRVNATAILMDIIKCGARKN